jgi:hypothetical protein
LEWLSIQRSWRLNSIRSRREANTNYGVSSDMYPRQEDHRWICRHRKAADPTRGREAVFKVVPGGRRRFPIPERDAVFCTRPGIPAAEWVCRGHRCKYRRNWRCTLTGTGRTGTCSGLLQQDPAEG